MILLKTISITPFFMTSDIDVKVKTLPCLFFFFWPIIEALNLGLLCLMEFL